MIKTGYQGTKKRVVVQTRPKFLVNRFGDQFIAQRIL